MTETKHPAGTALEPATLVRTHGAYVWRTLQLLGVPPGDVDDVTQEVLLVAIGRQHTFAGRSSLRSWIRGICVKKAAAHRRKAHVRREVVSAELPETASNEAPDEALDQSRRLRRLHAALDRLEQAPRAVFVLYEIEGLPMREVAETLGCPLQTAYSRHRAARQRVMAEMRRNELHADARRVHSQRGGL